MATHAVANQGPSIDPIGRAIRMLWCVAMVWLIPGCGNPDIDLTESPLNTLSETVGYGHVAKDGMLVTLDYHVYFESGKTLLRDASYRFQLGQGAVVRGIDEAVVGMREGGVKVISCPPQKHWGRAGYGDHDIPPNTTLLMRLTLKHVEAPEKLAPMNTRSSRGRRFVDEQRP